MTSERLFNRFIPQKSYWGRGKFLPPKKSAQVNFLWVFPPRQKKSAQVNFLWVKNDVRTAIQQFNSFMPPKNFYTPPKKNKFLATPLWYTLLLTSDVDIWKCMMAIYTFFFLWNVWDTVYSFMSSFKWCWVKDKSSRRVLDITRYMTYRDRCCHMTKCNN